MAELPIDVVGRWSEVKLDILREYATAYSRVFHGSKAKGLTHIYIDAFAGTGVHVSKRTQEFIPGSPLNALNVVPPFKEYHFIDLNNQKVQALEQLAAERKDVTVHPGDCNDVLLNELFPKLKFESYRRALCILDPYNIGLKWEVPYTAGQLGTVDIFINFMIMDMNMNVLLRNPHAVQPGQIDRMNMFWGDESWRQAAYRKKKTLFGDEDEKTTNDSVASGYRQRLRKVAGFKFVPEPIPMKYKGKTIYYLFFASNKPVAADIIEHIFDKYRDQEDRGQPLGDHSTIEWTEATWNPVTGCDKISPGCKHCYAERMAKRLRLMGQANYVNGFDVTLQEHALGIPLAWRRPRTIFVNSMSDLFHKDVPAAFIRRVFDAMNTAHWHQYQVLTKRADRLAELAPDLPWSPHIWQGVSVESAAYTWRIDRLRQTDAHVKFLSVEPLLGPIPDLDLSGIDWVIVGGESGPGARPMDPAWVRDIRDQCISASVAFFFKQWGGVNKKRAGRELDGRFWNQMPKLAGSAA